MFSPPASRYMEDYNTATFPSKKYYNIDIYHRRKMTKMHVKGMQKLAKKQSERTEFNDEEQKRQEMMTERAKQKEAEVEALKRSMQSGMGQAMREQAVLREEMQYHYRLGNFEAAAAIQRRLDPDLPGAGK
jgi:LPS O-antigen subunit length determinant protein (WzzB/FepE family)